MRTILNERRDLKTVPPRSVIRDATGQHWTVERWGEGVLLRHPDGETFQHSGSIQVEVLEAPLDWVRETLEAEGWTGFDLQWWNGNPRIVRTPEDEVAVIQNWTGPDGVQMASVLRKAPI